MRLIVIWEPVLVTDWAPPSTSALARISDPRALQFWDKGRLVSHLMGEHDRRSVVWDHLAVYSADATWNGSPPQPLFEGGPVVEVAGRAQAALAQASHGAGTPEEHAAKQ